MKKAMTAVNGGLDFNMESRNSYYKTAHAPGAGYNA